MSNADNRVLLAEDEEGLRLVLGRQIECAGFSVDYAADGTEAIALLQQREYAVVVTDMRMPRADGLQVMRAAKENWPDTEVIILTAYGSLENVLEAVRSGNLFDYLTKPLEDIRQISLAVHRAAEHRALRVQKVRLESDLSDALRRLKEGLDHLMLADRRTGIGKLAETVVREISAPLEAIAHMADYVTDKVRSLRTQEEDRAEKTYLLQGLERLTVAARHSMRLLNALLRYSRFDDSEPAPVSVNALVQDALVLLETEMVRSRLNLETHFSSEVPDVVAQASKLQQAITALLLNAIEATPPEGAVSILTSRSEDHPPCAVIEIRDTGRGMEEARLQEVLEQRYPNGIASEPRLGLPTAKAIVEELGGRIGLRSRLGEGTCVRVVLPGIEASRRPAPNPVPNPAPHPCEAEDPGHTERAA